MELLKHESFKNKYLEITDELKSIHFKSIFRIDFYLKRLIYVQKYGITHQTAMQQEIQEKEEFLQ